MGRHEAVFRGAVEEKAEITLPERARLIYVEIKDDEGREYRDRAIADALEAGEMPPYLKESSRLVGEGESAEGDIIIEYIRTLMDKLSYATTQKPSPEGKIYLCDQYGINTGVITKSPHPVIIVGLGMIDLLIAHGFGEDHLAGVMGHERFHIRRHHKWSDLSNGRPEETIGDIYGVMEAEKAGYNPQALGNLFRVLREAEKKRRNEDYHWGTSLSHAIDVHPDLDTRIRNTELALANLQLTRRMRDGQVAIPARVVEAVAKVRFKTHFEHHMERTGYAYATPAEQVSLLARYFHDQMGRKFPHMRRVNGYELRHYGTDPYLTNLYLYEARPALKALQGQDGVQDAAYSHFRTFAMKKVGFAAQAEDQYRWVMRHFAQLMSPPLPEEPEDEFGYSYRPREDADFDYRLKAEDVIPKVFQRMKVDTQAFWDATTRAEAVQAGKRYMAAKKTLERYHGAISVFDFYPVRQSLPYRSEISSAMQEHGHYRFPWENHLQWSLGKGETSEADKADSEFIGEIARYLGADCDKRFVTKDKEPYFSESLGWTFERLVFDENGNVTEILPSQEELEDALKAKDRQRFKSATMAELFEREYALQKQREETEAALVAQTDWTAMENNFWGFVKAHTDHLQPPIGFVPGKFPFAEKFMERLNALLKQDPDQWEKPYAVFLTGHEVFKIKGRRGRTQYHDENNRGDHAKYSLPYMIREFEDKYYERYERESTLERKRGTLPEGHPLSDHLADLKDRRKIELDFRRDKKTGKRREYKIYPKKVDPSEHLVAIRLKIPHTHPFARALFSHNIKSVQSKLRLSEKFDFADPEALTMEEHYKISPRRMIDYGSIDTPQGFLKVGQKSHTGEYMGIHPIWHYASGVELMRTLRRFDAKETPERFSISRLPYFLATHAFEQFKIPKVAKSLRKELRSLVDAQIERNRQIDFDVSTPLNILIERYLEDGGNPVSKGKWGDRPKHHNIFMLRPDLEESYQAHIRGRIMELPLAERAEHLSRLMSVELRHPEYRLWAVDCWIESATEKLGKDDGTEEYTKKALKFITESVRQINSAQGMNCLVRLLESIEAQKAVAMGGKDILSEVFGRRFLEKDGAMRVIESAIHACSHDPVLRDAFLKYITEPLTPEGTQVFAKLVKQRTKADSYDDKSFVGRFFNPDNRIIMSSQQENIVVDYLHQNFWAMPFGLRTIYLDRILFPVSDDSEENFSKACIYVLDKVLPDERKYAKEAREALLVYLDNCPPELRRTTFSAILATTEHSAETGELRPGEVLSNVMTRTGAAGGQLLQAAHSYLNGVNITDPELLQFREDLVSSKDNFDRPFRWDIFERMDEALPKDTVPERVGALLGSGSTAYVVEYGDDALKLMRKDVASIAELQFERFLKSFLVLAERHEIYKPLPAMVHHAERLIQISTSGIVGAKQLEYAQNCYNPLTITVDGKRHSFHVAAPVSAGPEYLRMERIDGPNINELHRQNALKADIRSNSIAIEEAFVYRLMQGKAMDQDMHGGQQGITPERIGMFDTGAIPFDPVRNHVAQPTDTEKRALGRLLGITFNAAMAGGSPVETLVKAVTTMEWGAAKQYLVGIKRGLLARSDIHAGFGDSVGEKSAVYRDIFRSVWKAGQFDPAIFRGIVDTLDMATCHKLAIFSISGNAPQSQITIQDSSEEAPYPVLGISKISETIVRSALRRAFNFAGMGRAENHTQPNSEMATSIELRLEK